MGRHIPDPVGPGLFHPGRPSFQAGFLRCRSIDPSLGTLPIDRTESATDRSPAKSSPGGRRSLAHLPSLRHPGRVPCPRSRMRPTCSDVRGDTGTDPMHMLARAQVSDRNHHCACWLAEPSKWIDLIKKDILLMDRDRSAIKIIHASLDANPAGTQDPVHLNPSRPDRC